MRITGLRAISEGQVVSTLDCLLAPNPTEYCAPCPRAQAVAGMACGWMNCACYSFEGAVVQCRMEPGPTPKPSEMRCGDAV